MLLIAVAGGAFLANRICPATRDQHGRVVIQTQSSLVPLNCEDAVQSTGAIGMGENPIAVLAACRT